MKWLILCILGVVGFIIVVNIFQIPPGNILIYGAVLICPLMHLFMMKSHDGKGNNHEKDHR